MSPPQNTVKPQQLHSRQTVALLLDSTAKTLANKESAGILPRPIQTPMGPRYTQAHLDYLRGAGPWPADAPPPTKKATNNAPKRSRGRPRIAQQPKGARQ